MADKNTDEVQPGGDTSSGGPTIEIPIGVIPPCDKYKTCKIIESEMAPVVYEYMGHVYFIGSLVCPLCSRYRPSDLYEAMDNELVAEHPDADQIVGVTSGQLADLSKVQPASGKVKVSGR